MTLLLALAAQCLHIALMLLAAPTLLGALDWAEARLAGRSAPSWRAPWQELARLCRKQPVRAENAEPLAAAAPLFCCAALAVGAALVPSFALGMLFARFSDLLVVGGLLALARVLLALAALDDGTATGGIAASQAITLALGVEPALLLVLLALGLAAGTTNVELIAGLQQVHMLQPLAAVVLVAAALALLAVVQRDAGLPEAAGLGGATLALARMAEGLRLLLWLDLIGALFAPLGMTSAQEFPVGWAVGLLSWVVRLAVAVGLLAALRVGVGRLRWRRVPAVLGVALALAALAGLLVLTRARPV
jgi:formate hydrogenlyase subunit 4